MIICNDEVVTIDPDTVYEDVMGLMNNIVELEKKRKDTVRQLDKEIRDQKMRLLVFYIYIAREVGHV